MNAGRWIWAACLAAVLSACGGGGGSSGDDGFAPPSADFDAQAAWRNLLTNTRTWVVSGTASDGLDYVVSISIASGGTLEFPVTGVTAARSTASVAMSQGGTAVADGFNETFFDGASFFVIGTRNSATGFGTSCSVATSAAAPPTAAAVGASGPLFTLDELDGCLSTSAKIGSATQTWSIESEAGIAYFCMNATERNVSGGVIATESDCVEIDEDGSLGPKARISVSAFGFTLVARN